MNNDLEVGQTLHVGQEVSVEKCVMEGKMNILEGVNSYHLNVKNITATVLRVHRIMAGPEGLHFHA